eukprot:TRINITY_DN12930_c0_g1_i1.p1 TRINITY_DN12930_c0_g1~~TRINITY_DN12930_c0_g1_i1.p1  ORF type:complete len:326 (+),score=73.32 TRINITY_DN12930_c0_g1_i1:38-1015(+)
MTDLRLFSTFILTIVAFIATCTAVPLPSRIILAAPWTPFTADGKVNLAQIPLQAAFAKKSGVNLVWVSGGMAQWDQLTLQERKDIMEIWVQAGHQHGLYMIVHVGAYALGDCIELAKHATAIGADAIAAIPSFGAENFHNMDGLVQWLSIIANTTHLPFHYYHIPGTTGYDWNMLPLLQASLTAIPTLAGIKYVNADFSDFQACVQFSKQHGDKWAIMWAVEPKLAAMPFGATHVVLAESYFAPYVIPMLDAWAAGDVEGAEKAQARRDDLANTMHGAGRYVMKMLGIDLGPPRLPSQPMEESQYNAVYVALQQWGFFNQTAVYY